MELEKVLRPIQYEMPPYPPKVITLANGKKMVVRQAEREDVPEILKSVHPCLFIERDYYDIVSARLYGELLAMVPPPRQERLLPDGPGGRLPGRRGQRAAWKTRKSG